MFFSKKLQKYIYFTVICLFLAIELPIIFVGQTAEPRPADVIIVLGAKLLGDKPSTMLELRLQEALRLYQAGYAPYFIVSGAQGRDEAISEAAAMREYLCQAGVPTAQIFIEDASYNTWQNLSHSQAIMRQHGWQNAIIVSNASHIRRSLAIAGQIGLSASGAPAPMADNAYYLTTKQYLREGAAMAALTLLPQGGHLNE